MKRLLIAIVALTLGYSAWWYWSVSAMRAEVTEWFAERRAAGWTASYGDLSIIGYPSRADATLTDLSIAPPDHGWEWSAPFFQILSLMYKQGHVILAWPNSQTFQFDETRYDITSQGLRASYIHDNGVMIRANLEAAVLNIGSGDNALALAGLTAAVARDGTSGARYRLAVKADGYAASAPVLGSAAAPEAVAGLQADLGVTLDKPFDIKSLSEPILQPRRIDIHFAEYQYGALHLKLAGQLDVSGTGQLDGKLTLRAQNWREMIDTARTEGALPDGVAEPLTEALALLASLSGNPNAIDIALTLSEGTVYFGPIPIGTAPRLLLP